MVKGHDLAAGLAHLIGHAAAFGGDERARACTGQRLRDLDGRQFASPGVEAGYDLEYGHHE